MNTKQCILKAIKDYERITGLRAIVLEDDTVVQSAAEKNFFCKCLKVSDSALAACEAFTRETYEQAKTLDSECLFACHAGLIKWAVPVNWNGYHCVIISEGVLVKEQVEDAEHWVDVLSKVYSIDKPLLLNNFRAIKVMDEEQKDISISLLKNLVKYYLKAAA